MWPCGCNPSSPGAYPIDTMEWLVSNALGIGEIAWINIVLSGDNAVVIGLASRSLPARQRTLGILFGAGAAILLRIAFAFIITRVMQVDYLKIEIGRGSCRERV